MTDGGFDNRAEDDAGPDVTISSIEDGWGKILALVDAMLLESGLGKGLRADLELLKRGLTELHELSHADLSVWQGGYDGC